MSDMTRSRRVLRAHRRNLVVGWENSSPLKRLMRTLVSRASLSARTSASERSQHCSSSYRTPDDRPSYPPSPSSLFPNYPLVFRVGSYRPRIGRLHRLRPKSSPSPEPLQVWLPGIFVRPLPSSL